MSEQGTELLVLLHTGEVVRLEDENECAAALDSLRRLEVQIRAMKAALSAALVQRAETLGTRTIRLADGLKATVSLPAPVVDPARLEAEYRRANMPEARINEIIEEVVTVTRKVRLVEAKRAATVNEVYRAALEAATVPSTDLARVSISGALTRNFASGA